MPAPPRMFVMTRRDVWTGNIPPGQKELAGWYFRQPGMYLLRRDDEVLYVGSTGTSMYARTLTHHRYVLRPVPYLADEDIFVFYPCWHPWLAVALEREAFDCFHPRFNSRRPPNKIWSLQYLVNKRKPPAYAPPPRHQLHT
jgi:hypothetical protein